LSSPLPDPVLLVVYLFSVCRQRVHHPATYMQDAPITMCAGQDITLQSAGCSLPIPSLNASVEPPFALGQTSAASGSSPPKSGGTCLQSDTAGRLRLPKGHRCGRPGCFGNDMSRRGGWSTGGSTSTASSCSVLGAEHRRPPASAVVTEQGKAGGWRYRHIMVAQHGL